MSVPALLSKQNLGEDAVSLKVYQAEDKVAWDNFVTNSKNGTFLFYRNYMEYHSDRFKDNSLLFFRKGQLAGLFPANLKGEVLFSHEGLTFGGVISGYNSKTSVMLQIFDALINYCRNQEIKTIVYKAVPHIYHSVPANEDLYALFRCNARLIARNASSCICLPNNREFSESRKCNIRKAKKNNITVRQSADLDSFMQIVQETLSERHNAKPVHTAEEIQLLANRFPDNIKLFASNKDDKMLAGVIIYESKNVAHEQYAANSKEGWSIGAQDLIEDYLINNYYKTKRYYDFGISTENQGHVLNFGLIARKEAFNANSIMYDIYQIDL
jgi:hypothetical protein